MASNKLLENITKNSTAYLTFFLLLVLIVISLKFNREGFTQGGELPLEGQLRLMALFQPGLNGPTGPTGPPGPTGPTGRAGDTHLNIIRNNQEIQNLFNLTSEDLNSDTAIRDKVVTYIVDQIFREINEGNDDFENFETNMFQKMEAPTTTTSLPTSTEIKAGTIIAWHISTVSPPEQEWQLCNGEPLQTQQFSNGSFETISGYSVPDLTGRFIVGGGYVTNVDGQNLVPGGAPEFPTHDADTDEILASDPPNAGYGDLPPSTLHTETVRMNPDSELLMSLGSHAAAHKDLNPTTNPQHRGRGKFFQYRTKVIDRTATDIYGPGRFTMYYTHTGGTFIKLQTNDLPEHHHQIRYATQVTNVKVRTPGIGGSGRGRDDDQQCSAGEAGCNVSNLQESVQTDPYGSADPEKFRKLPPFLNLRHYIKKPKDLAEFECDYINPHEGRSCE
jgi:hypothetical protein